MNSGETANPVGKCIPLAAAVLALLAGGCVYAPVEPPPETASTALELHPNEQASHEEHAVTSVEKPSPEPVIDEELSLAQEVLKAMGLYSGRVDGIYGPKSRQALLDYQNSNGLSLTGVLDLETRYSLFGSQQ